MRPLPNPNALPANRLTAHALMLAAACATLTGCATHYDRWQAVKSERGLYAWASCMEREGVAATEDAAANVRAWGPDEQPPIATGNWALTAALRACADVDRAARAALSPAQNARLERDAARAITNAIAAAHAEQEAGIS